MKPQLANDADINTMLYPNIWGMPKIDGVRAWNPTGTLLGRSMDPFKGFGITDYFSKQDFLGLDGEMTLGASPVGDRLCHLTTGAMGAFKGITAMADMHWHVFDLVTPYTTCLPYDARYEMLRKKVEVELKHERIHLVPFEEVNDKARALRLIGDHLDLGYEGTIFRNRVAPAKEGRPGKKEQQLVRVKPWMDSEALVVGITEGETNTNEAKVNSLGRTERSSAQEGKVKNGTVGTIHAVQIADVFNPFTGELMFKKGEPLDIGPGVLTAAEKKQWWDDRTQLIGWIVKYKHLAYGVKDKPRMGTYLSRRVAADIEKQLSK